MTAACRFMTSAWSRAASKPTARRSKRYFTQHQIPIAGAIEAPLAQFPLTKAVILLLNLPAQRFSPRPGDRSVVLALFSIVTARLTRAPAARPDLWDLATRELAICKGIAEWRRLRNYLPIATCLLSQHSDDDEPRVIRIGAAQLQGLAEIVEIAGGGSSESAASRFMASLCRRVESIAEKIFGIGSDDADDAAEARKPRCKKRFLTSWISSPVSTPCTTHVSLSDFSHTFQHWLERSTFRR